MSIGDIMSDALVYPFQNIKAFVLYIVLGIVAAIIGGSTILDLVAAASSIGLSGYVLTGVGIVGVIVSLLILFLIEGYALDIVKFGIERRAEGPGIDFGRQVSNAIKLIVVDIVYYIVPCIIIFVLGLFLKNWILTIISLILIIVFALANFMARCRLAQTDNLAEALAIGEAIGDISRVGIGRILATVILVILVAFIIVLIVGAIYSLNDIIGSIILGLASVYIVFFYHRAIGLLYSE